MVNEELTNREYGNHWYRYESYTALAPHHQVRGFLRWAEPTVCGQSPFYTARVFFGEMTDLQFRC
jgi:peptidoglycan/xylan/chitin deacetylase (PgdA/CDA1 family)